MAAFQRRLKRRLLIPSRAVVWECLRDIQGAFVAAALADWAEMPRQQVTPSMRRRTLLARVVSGVRLIIVAVTPIVVARLFDRYDVIPGPIPEYASALAYGWLVLVLLRKLDPELKDNVGLLKDAVAMLKAK